MAHGPTGYTTDHSGKKSAHRIISIGFAFVSAIIGLLVAVSVYNGQGDNHMIGVYLALLFLVASVAPNAIGKYFESQVGDNIIPTPRQTPEAASHED